MQSIGKLEREDITRRTYVRQPDRPVITGQYRCRLITCNYLYNFIGNHCPEGQCFSSFAFHASSFVLARHLHGKLSIGRRFSDLISLEF